MPHVLIKEHAPHGPIETFEGISKYVTKKGPGDTIHMDFQKVLNKVSHHRLSRILSSLETKRNSQMKYWKKSIEENSFYSRERSPGDFCQ